MTRINRLIIQALLIVLAFGCSTAKYSVTFKSQKKTMDTLIINKPYVLIIADNMKTQMIDVDLTKSNEDLIKKNTIDLLSKKYFIKQLDYMKFDKDSLISLCNNLEKCNKTLNGFSIQSFLCQTKYTSGNQFGLIILFYGGFNPNYETNYNLKTGIKTNTVYYDPMAKPYSDMVLMIIDFKKEQVVYFDRKNSSNFDPRLPDQIEQMTMNLLRPIYYK